MTFSPESRQYGQELLLLLQNTGTGAVDTESFPEEIIRHDSSPGGMSSAFKPKHGARKRGRRGGVRQQLKRQGHRRIPLPSIILVNAQSLWNKLDDLQANVKFLSEYKSACLIAVTETWLKQQDLQPDLAIDGFGEPLRQDRDSTVTGKSLGGGLCLYVNKKWCSTSVVRETLCTPDIELLSVSLRPFYLPREFPQIFITLVYIHPKPNATNATWAIADTVHRLQNIAPSFIMGDFNHCKLGKSLANFHQYVTCPTRNMRCLDLCYGSIKGAYKSFQQAPLGTSDHSVVYLCPTYKPVLKETKPERRLVPVWSAESTQPPSGLLPLHRLELIYGYLYRFGRSD